MKKFQFLSAAAVALLLASCSSDAPDAPQPVNGDNNSADMMYMSLRLKTNTTRAEGDETVNPDEAINNVTLYVFDNAGACLYSNTTTDIDNGIAYYQVAQTTFKVLASTNQTLDVYVVCNAPSEYGTFFQTKDDVRAFEMTVAAADVAGKLANADNGYVMAGSTQFTVSKADDSVIEGGNKKEDAFEIADNVNVDRLVARFDYKMADTPAVEGNADGFTFTLAGIETVNRNNKVWMFHHGHETSYTVAKPAFFFNTKQDWIKYENPSTTNFACAAFKTYAKSIPTGRQDFILPMTNKEDVATYDDVTFVVLKYKFEKEGVTDKNRTLFTYDGEMLGFAEDLKNYTNEDKARENMIRGFWATAMRYENMTEANQNNTTLEVGMKELIDENLEDGFAYFAPDQETNEYYTYYCQPVSINTATDGFKDLKHYAKYRVDRNTIYSLNVSKITGFGKYGNETPGVIDPDLKKWWIDLTISVNDWNEVDNTWTF